MHCLKYINTFRLLRTSIDNVRSKRYMEVWNVVNIGSDGRVEHNYTENPILKCPNEIMVEVHASSVNPLDARMMRGYGKNLFGVIHSIPFWPLNNSSTDHPILGRDFSGVITSVGQNVSRDKFKPGDEVWGVVDPLQKIGCHAEYLITNSKMITKKPSQLSHVEAASFPYAAMTAWSAISTIGCLSEKNARGKKVLLLGASGGVGTIALQLLKYWNTEVISVCSSMGKSTVESLGSDATYDYIFDDLKQELFHHKNFDYIFDFTGVEDYDWTMDLLKTNTAARYITIGRTFIKDIDEMSFLGPAKSAYFLAKNILPNLTQGKLYQGAFFIPNLKPLKVIGDLTASGMMKPVINKVFPFYELPSAYDATLAGGIVGKNVIDFKDKSLSAEEDETIDQEQSYVY